MQYPFVMDVLGTWTHLGEPFQDLKDEGRKKAKVLIPLERLLTFTPHQKCFSEKVIDRRLDLSSFLSYNVLWEMCALLLADPLKQVTSTAKLHCNVQMSISWKGETDKAITTFQQWWHFNNDDTSFLKTCSLFFFFFLAQPPHSHLCART